jgi:hypothetical protein
MGQVVSAVKEQSGLYTIEVMGESQELRNKKYIMFIDIQFLQILLS